MASKPLPLTIRCLLMLLALTSIASASQPNIIFFLTDDLGYGDLGSFWQDDGSTSSKRFDTPGLDAMAAAGVKLTHHYVSAPVCAPARASFFQGRHQGHADVRNSQFDKALANNHTIASVLKQAGYRTIHVGKNGLAGGEGSTTLTGTGSQNLDAHPLDRGFDEFFGYLFHGDGHEHYPTNGTTNKTAHIYNGYQQIKNASVDLYTADAWTAYAKDAIIREVQDGDSQPFFLYVAYDSPHFKMQRPAVAYPTIDTDGNPLTGGIQWTTATDGAGNVRYASTANGAGIADGYTHPDIPAGWLDSEKQHVGMIRRLDNSVADILRLLEDLGIEDDTICVFTSDNGPHNEGNNPRTFESFADLEGIKRDLLEGGIRVPTIVHWPTNLPSATNDDNDIAEMAYPSGMWDWMPTFLELAGVDAPAYTDGVSLVPTLTEVGTQRDKGYLYFEFESSGNNSNTPNWTTYFTNHANEVREQMQVIRIGDFSGIRRDITSATDDFEIYDVVNDPGQGTDLASSMLGLQEQMKYLSVAARRKGAGVTRPYDTALIPATTLSTSEVGLTYETFLGPWQWVPEFRDMTPVASGSVAGLDLSIRPQDDDFGVAYIGYINIPTAGAWTFHLTSDTGAGLWIHDGHVIDDDFNHPTGVNVASSASVYLKAGLHPIRLYYHHGNGTRSLDLEWEGPSTNRATVPNASLVRAVPVPPGPPTANSDTVQTAGSLSSAGTQVVVPVLANDTDDGTPVALSIALLSSPKWGSASISGDYVLYTPVKGFLGKDTFDYTITDGSTSATASVLVDVVYEGSDYWYPFNEGVGTTTAEAGGGRLASLDAFPLDSSQWVSGQFSGALDFDGVDDAVLITGFNGVTGAADRTVSAWIKTTATGNKPIVGWGANANGQKWSLLIQGGTLRLEVTGGYQHGATVVNDGQWHHVAATFANDGTPNVDDVLLYIDGVLETSLTGTSSQAINTSAANTAEIGDDVQDRNFNGLIDDARIYSRALSALEVAALANQTQNENQGTLWYLRYLGNATPSALDWLVDNDGDGCNAFVEFTQGDSPFYFKPSVYPEIRDASGQLVYKYNRRTALSASVYNLYTSSDLVQWDPWVVLAASINTAPATQAGFEEVEISIIPGVGAQFYRLDLVQ